MRNAALTLLLSVISGGSQRINRMLEIFYEVCAYIIVFSLPIIFVGSGLVPIIGAALTTLMGIPVGTQALFAPKQPEPKPMVVADIDNFDEWLKSNTEPESDSMSDISDYVTQVMLETEEMMDDIDKSNKMWH